MTTKWEPPKFEDDVPVIVVLLALVVVALSALDDFCARLSSNVLRRLGVRSPSRDLFDAETAEHVAWLRSLREDPERFVDDDPTGYTADWDGSIIAVAPGGRAQVEQYPKLAAQIRANNLAAFKDEMTRPLIPRQRAGS